MRVSAALALSAFLFFGSSSDRPTLNDFRVSLQGRQVEVSVQLVNGFTDELFERIETGLATGYTYHFVLYRDQKRWWDNKLDSSKLDVTASYDAVTREFLINYKQNGKVIDSRIARDRDELERFMTHIDGVTVFELGALNPKRRYLLRGRAILGSKTSLLIIPSQITTEWVRSRKFRPPAEDP